MKYPMAGDLQRQLGVDLTDNPCECASSNPCECAKNNPWEVRSDSGLEGVYADEDEAHSEAEDLRKAGVPGVTVDRRERATRPRPARHALHNPAGWQVSRSVTNVKQGIEILGNAFAATSYFRNIGVEVEGVGYGWLERCYGGTGYEPTCLVELVNGRVEAFPARLVWPVAGRYPERPRRNPSSRLFTGVYPTGIVYADRERERDGDYLRVARLPFSSLRLQWEPGNHPAELRAEIEADAAAIIARRGQPFEVSSSGQTVILGGEQSRPPGAPPQYYAPQGRPPGVPNRSNPPRVTREKYGDDSEIVIEHNRYGYTGWLESKRGGGRLPISFGATRPETAREAIELAKKFLASVYGRSNPAGLTAKGERMYEHIKAGYGDDPRAEEIASRTVLARAGEVPGLKRNADARWRVWLAHAPDSYVHVTAGGYMDAMRKAALQFRGAQNNEVVEMIAKIDGGRAIESLVTIHHGGRLTFHPDPSRGVP